MTSAARGIHYIEAEIPWLFDLDAVVLTGETITDHKITVANANGLTVPDSGPQGSTHTGPFVVRDEVTGEERIVQNGVQFWPLGGLTDPAACEPPPLVGCTVNTSLGRKIPLDWTLVAKPRPAA